MSDRNDIPPQDTPILTIKWLCKRFPLASGPARRKSEFFAVNGISLKVFAGEALCIVGESGSGKTTLARMIVGLETPCQGEIYFKGQRVDTARGRQAMQLRQKMQMIFQDPYGSLNPRMTVKQMLMEPLRLHRRDLSRKQVKRLIKEVLNDVGADKTWLERYPHQLSGGQRQRVAIARALVLEPELIVADEPVSALDVSVQAQVLNLLMAARKNKGITFIFITHDLAVVESIATRVAVMYRGQICELAPREALFDQPLHPYTQLLLSGVPTLGGKPFSRQPRFDDSPQFFENLRGCPFYPRCAKAQPQCRREMPILKPAHDDNHFVACHAVEAALEAQRPMRKPEIASGLVKVHVAAPIRANKNVSSRDEPKESKTSHDQKIN